MAEEKSITKNYKQVDWLPVLILLVAAFLRFFLLDIRTPHHDEGVNGWFADRMLEMGFYKYDPVNYHGPLHFYIIFLFQTLLGHANWILRLPSALVSLLSVYWIFLFSNFVGRRTVLFAAIGMALSPAFVYYGRFAIHESDLLFFLILILWGLIGLYKEGKVKYLWALGLGITGAILTKETYIIHLVCFILAYLVLLLWEKVFPSSSNGPAKQTWTIHNLMYVLITCIFLIVFFYSGNFLNSKGLSGLYETFNAWFKTGSLEPTHKKPFSYWIDLFLKYELVASLGMLCCLRFVLPSSRIMRYIAIYSLGVFLAYSIVSYKTPWCSISILWTFFLLLGAVITELLNSRLKLIVSLAATAAFISSFTTSLKLNFINHTERKEPYVYVHTLNEINKLTEPLKKINEMDPTACYRLTGNIMRTDEWPVPWLLWNYSMVGYYGLKSIPSHYNTDFLLVESRRTNEVEANLKEDYFTETLRLRDAQDFSRLYLSYKEFKDVFPDRKPGFSPTKIASGGPGNGLVAVFYHGTRWEGKPALKKKVNNIDFYWEGIDLPLAQPFSVEFIGEINIQSNTTLVLYTDDGGYVEIDDVRIIDDPGPHVVTSKSAKVSGKSGWRRIKVGFYDQGGGAVVRLTKEEDKKVESYIPATDLRFDERLLK